MSENADSKFNYLFAALLGVTGLLIILIFVTVRSQADTGSGTASSTISNAAISATSVTLGGTAYTGGTMTVAEGTATGDTTTNLTFQLDYSDDSGCVDFSSFKAKVYKDGTTCADGGTDYHDCYEEDTLSSGTFTCTNTCETGATSGYVSCTFPIRHFAEPGTWVAQGYVVDGAAANSTVDTNFTMASLQAIALDSSMIDLGTLAVGATTTADKASLAVVNTGNGDIGTLQVKTSGDFSCANGGSFTTSYLKVSTSTGQAYESLPLAFSTSDQSVNSSVAQQTVADSASSQTLTFGLKAGTGCRGNATTNVTVTGS